LISSRSSPAAIAAWCSCCSRCGRSNLESPVVATLHEASCEGPVVSNASGPWKCAACGKRDFVSSSGFASHRDCCLKEGLSGASVSLHPACLESKRGLLSDFNFLVTESIELVEVSSEDAGRIPPRLSRKIAPKVGDIGIRCVYCAAKGIQPAGSNMYPRKLKNLAHTMYNLVTRHLMSSCQNIPKSIQKQLKQDRKKTTSQSMMKDRIGLPVYLQLLSNEFGLTDDDGESGGIRCSVD